MKTKKKKAKKVVAPFREKITNTTLSEIGFNISRFLDIINDPRFKNEKFRQIYRQSDKSCALSASNDDMFISFTVEMKGGDK